MGSRSGEVFGLDMKPPLKLSRYIQFWNQILVWVGTTGAVILFVLPWTRGGPAAWFFVFMASMAILITVLQMSNKIQDLDVAIKGQFRPKKYPDMAGAKDDIVESILTHAKRRGSEALQVRVVGMRLRTVREVLALVLAREEVRKTPIELVLYHIDPDTLEGWRNPADSDSQVFQKEASLIRGLIEDIPTLVKGTSIAVRFVGFKEHPMFHGWIIGGEEVFWGYAVWDDNLHTFRVAHNPCFRIRRSDEHLGDLLDWALNRCDVYERWSKVNQYADLGYVGSLPERRSLGEVIAKLPDDTRIIRMLGFSGDYNFQHSGASKRLAELLKNGKTKIEYLTINPDSPFVAVRTVEHREWNEASLRYRVTLGKDRITTLLENAAQEQGGKAADFGEVLSFDQWAVWRMMFVNDETVYVMFYPVGEPPKYPKVWIFKRDPEGRSMFWPLLKEYFTYKYYSHIPACDMTHAEITRTILSEAPKYG